MTSKLLVFGGNGLLGKRICQEAVKKGFQVVSLSRSGKPPQPQSIKDNDWINEVQWESGDIFCPETYHKQLIGTSNVVHSLGILLEDENYKKTVRKPLSNVFDPKAWLPALGLGSNPLNKSNPNFTYDRMNKQSALILADAFMKTIDRSTTALKDMPTFTYISADKGFPIIPKGYINSKRQAEVELMRHEDIFRPILVRPGFMYDEYRDSKDARFYIHNTLEFFNCGNRLILGNKLNFINELIRPTVSTQQVSRCIISKIEDLNFKGVVPLEVIKKA